MKIAVFGLGRCGLVTANGLAQLGHHVTGYDVDGARVRQLSDGGQPFYEPGLFPLHRNLRVTDDPVVALRNTSVAMICVPTPASDSGEPDLDAVFRVARDVALYSTGELVLVEKSTVPPGTAEQLRAALPERVRVAANPEFLREGTAVRDFASPDRIVLGADDAMSRTVLRLVYGHRYNLIETSVTSAELAKYACNAFLATKLSFVNGLVPLCDRVGASVSDVTRVMGMDPRIGADYLRPSLGFGGSCLEKDTTALRELAGEQLAKLLDRVLSQNNAALTQTVAVVLSELLQVPPKQCRVALLGIAYKPDTDDTRNSPALRLARTLGSSTELRAYDPVARSTEVRMYPSVLEAIEGAQVVVVSTAWPIFIKLDWEHLAIVAPGATVVDPVGCLDSKRVIAAGFSYVRPGDIVRWTGSREAGKVEHVS